jgi:hypothetical protein
MTQHTDDATGRHYRAPQRCESCRQTTDSADLTFTLNGEYCDACERALEQRCNDIARQAVHS